MSSFRDHYFSSLENVKVKYPEIFNQEKDKVERLLLRLHAWLDWYAGKKGEDEEGLYDFTSPYNKIRHRAKRHHREGINIAIEKFSRGYGVHFAGIVREEAERHVRIDVKCAMKGQIPFKTDYPGIFWKNFKQ